MTRITDDSAEQWVTLAKLLRPQGRCGEILSESLTDFPESLAGRTELYLVPPGSESPDDTWRRCEIGSAWMPQGKNAGRVVLAFVGVIDIASAERLVGFEVRTPEGCRLTLGLGSVYISDLVGCDLWDREQNVGRVTDVHFPTSADGRRRLSEAPALLLLETLNGEVLIPFVSAHFINIDREAKRLQMELPKGLLESQLIDQDS